MNIRRIILGLYVNKLMIVYSKYCLQCRNCRNAPGGGGTKKTALDTTSIQFRKRGKPF